MTTDKAKSKAKAAIRITLVSSHTGCKPKQRATLRALGLRKIGQSVVHEDTDPIRGMIDMVSHLVAVKQVD